MWTLLGPRSVLMFKHRQQRKTVQMYVDLIGAQSILMFKHLNIDNYGKPPSQLGPVSDMEKQW